MSFYHFSEPIGSAVGRGGQEYCSGQIAGNDPSWNGVQNLEKEAWVHQTNEIYIYVYVYNYL